MVSPLIFQDQSGLAQGISTAGGALAQALQQRGKQQREEQLKMKRQEGFSGLMTALQQPDLDPNIRNQSVINALSKNVKPEEINIIEKVLQSSKKQDYFKTALDRSLDVGGLSTPEGQSAFIEAYAPYAENPMEVLKLFKKDTKNQTVFDKKIDEFKAESVIDYIQGGKESSAVLSENLDYLESNIDKVGRAKGIATGEFLWSGKEFTEYRNRGNLVLDGVIKVFNKAGVLPQKKLEWIRKTFAISPFDTKEQIKGKIASLRTLASDATGFRDKLGDLIDKYGNNIPNEEFIKLQTKVDKNFRKFEQQIDSPEKETVVNKLPASAKKGSIATNTETGQKFIYSGTRWIKQK